MIFTLTLALTLILMYGVWLWAVRLDNFGIVDSAWSAGFTVQAVVFFTLTGGYTLRRALLAGMLILWSLRLSYYLTSRIYRHHPAEDTRYAGLRRDYGAAYRRRFLVFFMYQALSISLLTLPFISVLQNPSQTIRLVEWAGVVCFLLALAGESLADAQMSRFKRDPRNAGRVCDVGLWRYSRHPNYFFESCIWFSFFVFMLGTENMLWAIYAPLTILLLLLKVTGVPPSEAQSLRTRGEAYRKYQGKTSVFVPWFVKE